MLAHPQQLRVDAADTGICDYHILFLLGSAIRILHPGAVLACNKDLYSAMMINLTPLCYSELPRVIEVPTVPVGEIHLLVPRMYGGQEEWISWGKVCNLNVLGTMAGTGKVQ